MAAIGIGAILMLLFLLGCTLAVIVATGAALVHGRFILAAVIAGGAFFFLIVGAGLLSLFAAIGAHSTVVVSEPHAFDFATQPPNWVPQFTMSQTNEAHAWRFSFFPTIFIIGLGAFLLARFSKHHFAHAAAGHHSAWPILVAVAIVAFLVLGGLRATKENERTAIQKAAEANAQFRVQAESFAQQQRDLAKRAVEMSKDLHQRIDKTDIVQLMDEFDAPRIVLQAPFSTVPSPAALMFAAAPTAFQSLKDSATAEATATIDQSTEHNKSTDHIVLKSKKKAGSKPASSTVVVTKNGEQPTVVPVPPTPPAAPAPTAAPAVAEVAAPEFFDGEQPSDDELKPSKTKVLPPASGWHIRPRTAGKPGWIENPPKRTGDVRREVIATDPYSSAEECYRAAEISLMLKAYDRLQELEGSPYATRPDGETLPISFIDNKILLDGQTLWNGKNWSDNRLLMLNAMGIDPDFLLREIVARDSKKNESCEYLETIESSAGPMKKLYMQIEFTPDVERELTRRWDAFHRSKQFAHVGLGAFSILGLLSFAWGLLKLDTATKGYYTKWLFVGAPIAIISVAALTLLAYMSVPS